MVYEYMLRFICHVWSIFENSTQNLEILYNLYAVTLFIVGCKKVEREPGLEPRPVGPESSALTIRSLHLP